jgi:hypothetical protein
MAQVDPIEQADNEARMRDWILNRHDGARPAAAQPSEERRGFFRRLFGG